MCSITIVRIQHRLDSEVKGVEVSFLERLQTDM